MREPPDCVVLGELFSSPRGNVCVGRLIQDGRLALLREVPTPTPSALEQAVESARGVTHPMLLKVLGLATDGHRRFIASEYIPGVSLLELNAAIRRRQRGMDAAAAVRLMLGALARVADARELLAARGEPPVRLLHGDCVWIAEFGETMLAEALVSSRLRRAPSPPLGAEVEIEDVQAAAVELFQLTSARLMTGDIGAAARRHLPTALARIIEAAFVWDPSSDLDTARGFARALRSLPAALVGSDQSVVDELKRLVPDLLEERQRKLASREIAARDLEGPTRVYSVADAVRAQEEADESEEETASLPGQLPATAMKPVEQQAALPDPSPSTPQKLPASAAPALAARKRSPALALPAPHRAEAAPLRAELVTPRPRSGRAPWSSLDRLLLATLVALLIAVVVVALRHPERVAALFGGARGL